VTQLDPGDKGLLDKSSFKMRVTSGHRDKTKGVEVSASCHLSPEVARAPCGAVGRLSR
jgi:hypothetical protein